MKYYSMREKKRLGDILVNSGKITSYQLEEALERQKLEGKKLGEILVDNNIITEDEIIDCIEEQTGIEKIDLNTVDFDMKVISLVSDNLCKKYSCIPFGFSNNKIKVVLADPLNIFAIDDLEISTGFEIETYITRKHDIKKFIGIYYSSQQIKNAAIQLSKEVNKNNEQANKLTVNEMDLVDSAPVVKMVDYLFKNSIEMNVSDIHIEPFENEIRIRYRIDGKLKTMDTLGIENLAPLVTRIKILAGIDITEKRIPQDGKIVVNFNSSDVDLRVSILPVIYGEKIVIRILNVQGNMLSRADLGMCNEDVESINRILSHTYGIILVTGPTGSGKSTTLYSILSELNKDDTNIITVEDPVEYTVDGINQVNVNEKAGLTFSNGLRSILRQDPDVVMIGEIRDEETAQIATRAAITGHLVMSTLHTNDAPSSVVRLLDMGIKPYLLATSITGVIAQRLVRRVCEHCKQSYVATEMQKKELSLSYVEDIVLYKGKGCGYCNKTGYSGRIGIYEIMEIGRIHRDAISNNANADTLRDISVKDGMKTLKVQCEKLLLDGITSFEEFTSIV